MLRNLEQQTFATGELAPNDGPAPLAAFYRLPEPHPDMNPGIWIFADRVQPWMGSPLDIAEMYLDTMRESAFEPHVAHPPARVELAGRPAVRVVFEQRLVIAGAGFSHCVSDVSTLVYHDGHVIWLAMQDSRDEPVSAPGAFDRVLDSVRLT